MKKEKMQNALPLRIQFRHMPVSDSIRQLIQQQLQSLQKLAVAGSHCEVVLDEMHQWHKRGHYKVSIRYTQPGHCVYVATAEEENSSREFLYSAIRIAVDKIERQLKKSRRRMRRRQHEVPEAEYAV